MNKSFNKITEKNFSNFSDFEFFLKNLHDSNEKGDIFEEFNRLYFEFFRERYNLKEIWFENSPGHEIPNSEKTKLGISQTDKGADGLVKTFDDKYYLVQTKFRGDRSSPTYTDLTNTFYQARNCDGTYVFSNSHTLPKELDDNNNFYPILFDELINLDEDSFKKILESAKNPKATLKKKLNPRPYQKRAIDKIVKGFKAHDRGKYIAACGSGKTLTALWVKEKMESQKTLFVVPSIYLIKQTLEQWIDQRSNKFAFCCVCSSEDINLADNDESDNLNDLVDLDPRELGVQVTTDKYLLEKFLDDNKDKNIVIFSTYQSSKVVSDAINKGDIIFDLTICDEAHKTAGVEKKVFSKVLDDNFIKSTKRLFLTATPKVLTNKTIRSANSMNFDYYSMDDPTDYGPEFDTFSFSEAIKEGAIVNYEILISAVNKADTQEFKLLNNYSLQNNDAIKNKDIAITIATEKLMSDRLYDVDKALNFSNTIKRSEQFIKNINLPGINSVSFGKAASISSKQSSSGRRAIMNEFISENIAILSNARCLTEGVDIPGVDAVIFSDRKTSKIDIVQAVGRALRLNKNKPNKTAKIFIPIFIDKKNQNLDYRKYGHVFEIIESLKMHDNELSIEIDNLYGALIGTSSGTQTSKIKINAFKNVKINKLKKIIVPQVAQLNGDIFKNWKLKYSGKKTKKPKVDFSLIDRHNIKEDGEGVGGYITRENLGKFSSTAFTDYQTKGQKLTGKKCIPFITNNFLPHTVRYELIEKRKINGITQLKLTSSGQDFVNGKKFTKIAAELFDKKNNLQFFPYNYVKEILKSVKRIDDLGFMYGINLMVKDDSKAIEKAIKRIKKINKSKFNFLAIKKNLQATITVISMHNEEFEKELKKFNFEYEPEEHVFLGGLPHEFNYLGGQMAACWPKKFRYDKKNRILSIK